MVLLFFWWGGFEGNFNRVNRLISVAHGSLRVPFRAIIVPWQSSARGSEGSCSGRRLHVHLGHVQGGGAPGMEK